MAGAAFEILVNRFLVHHSNDSRLALALRRDRKGWISILIYLNAIAISTFNTWISCGLYVLIAIMWLVPYRGVEKTLKKQKCTPHK